MRRRNTGGIGWQISGDRMWRANRASQSIVGGETTTTAPAKKFPRHRGLMPHIHTHTLTHIAPLTLTRHPLLLLLGKESRGHISHDKPSHLDGSRRRRAVSLMKHDRVRGEFEEIASGRSKGRQRSVELTAMDSLYKP